MNKLTMKVLIPKNLCDEIKYAIAGHSYDFFITSDNGKRICYFGNLNLVDTITVSVDDALTEIDSGIAYEERRRKKGLSDRLEWMMQGKNLFNKDLKNAKAFFVSKLGVTKDMRVLAVKKINNTDDIVYLLFNNEYHFVTVVDDSERNMVYAINDDGKKEKGVRLGDLKMRGNYDYIFLTFDEVNQIYDQKINYIKNKLETYEDAQKRLSKTYIDQIDQKVR